MLIRFLYGLAILTSGPALPDQARGQRAEPGPLPVTNNAVAAGPLGNAWWVFSALGVDSTHRWSSGITTRAHASNSADVAWITYCGTDDGHVEGKRVSNKGTSTRIFVREDGKWLCIHGYHTLAS